MGMPQLLQVTGLVIGFFVALEAWRSSGGSREDAAHRLLLAAPLIFVGGKAWFLAEHRLAPTLANLLAPGYSLYGSVLLVLLFWTLWKQVRPFPLLCFLDCVAPAAAIGLVFGRLACFVRGCCSGLPTDTVWGIRLDSTALLYREYVARGWTEPALRQTVPLHATQLYESGFGIVAFIALCILLSRRRQSGRVFLSGALAYGLFRLFVESVRIHPAPAVEFGHVYLTQWFSLAMVALSLVGLWILDRRSGSAACSRSSPSSSQTNGTGA